MFCVFSFFKMTTDYRSAIPFEIRICQEGTLEIGNSGISSVIAAIRESILSFVYRRNEEERDVLKPRIRAF